MRRPGLIVPVLLSTCLLTGCGVKVRVHDEAPDFAARLRPGAVVAVVGVTAAPGAGRLAPLDAADAADALFAALIAGAPSLTVWAAPVTAEALGATTVDSLLAEHARLGAVPAARVSALKGRLSAVEYLVVGRVLADAIATETATQGQSDPEARAEGQPELESPLMLGMSTERKTVVELVFLDLVTGKTAWLGEAQAADRIRYEYAAPDVDPLALARDAQQAPAAAVSEPPLITRAGDGLRAPDLVDLLGRAFRELVADLPGAAQGKP